MEKQSEKAKFDAMSGHSKIIYKFLSQLADHYNKNSHWRASQQGLYEKRFKQIPNDFLKESFLKYLTDQMDSFIPSLPQVYDFVKSQRGFDKYWEFYYYGGQYCVNCRTDKEGKEGGYRNIFIWGWKDGRPAGRVHIAKCDCDAGLKLQGPNYHDLIAAMRAKHPDNEITYSYYNGEKIIDSKSQSSMVWEERLQRGSVTKSEDGQYLINWDHEIWASSVGIRICNDAGIEVPKDIIMKVEHKLSFQKSIKERSFKKRNAKAISSDDFRGSIPRSISGLL